MSNKCQRCNSTRIVSVAAHCSDMCSVSINDKEVSSGYVPYGIGIGGDDDVEFDLCLNCGQQQGTWPLPESKLESKLNGSVSTAKKQFLQKQDQLIAEHRDIVESVLKVAALQDVSVYEIMNYLFDNCDDNPERIAAAIISLYRNPAHAIMAETVLDKFYGWEHYFKLESLVEFDDDVDDE